MSEENVFRIAALLRHLPPPGSDDQTRAAWYEQKAGLFDAIAEDDPSVAEQARQAADRARDYARRLRREAPRP